MRYAAYIRTSSKGQSVDAQRRALAAWIAAHAGQLVKVYVDDGQSRRIADRPGLQKMLREAQDGEFDALVVHHLDRLARDPAEVQTLQAMLARCNVEVIALNAASGETKEIYE